MKKFEGVFPALLTPYNEDGSINCESLCRLVEMNIEKGCGGFYVGGSTSEAFMLSEGERRTVLETVMAQNKGRVRIIAHIGCISTEQSVRLARHAEQSGADAVSAVPPFYYGFSGEEIKAHYFAIADAVSIPVVVYNFTPNGGGGLTDALFEAFLSDRRFLGVKHTSSDMFRLERFKSIRPDAVIFNGFDEMFLSGLAAGADGGIGSTYNFMAEKFIRIREKYLAGDMQAALAEQKKANNIIHALLKVGVIPGCKAILDSMGIPMGDARKPMSALTDEQKTWIINIYKENV